MNTVVEKLPKCLATLRVDVPADEVAKERATIIGEIMKKVRIPGFRPGKTPRALVEKKMAKDIRAELIQVLVDAAGRQAIEQNQLKILHFGRLEDLTFGDDNSFSFHSTLTLAPDFTLPEYKGIAVTIPPAELPEGAVDDYLRHLSERYTDFNDITGRGAELGDFVVIDYTSTVDGQPTDEFLGKSGGYLSGREGYWVRLDEEFFLPGFAAQAVGMNVGDTRDIPVALPADFAVASLAGKTLVLATTLKELKQSVPAALDDELAKRLAPDTTMEQVKENILTNLTAERERKISDLQVGQVVAYLNSKVDFEIPEDLVLEETQTLADDMVERGIKAGLTEEEITARQDEIFGVASQQAAANIRTNFILREIAEAEKLSIADTELLTHLVNLAVSRKMDPKKFITDLRENGRVESVRRSMLVGKTIDFLLEHVTVTVDPAAPLPE